jgi:serine/threonine protein kinase
MGQPRFSKDDVAAALGGEVSLLGSGSFGDIWRLGDTAVKIICADSYPVARLAREVDGLRRVTSVNVVRLLSTGDVFLGGRQRPILTFEYIPGGDLGDKIRDGKWPSLADAISLMDGLLCGVKDLHGSGTVHRDIKPHNIALRNGDWSQAVLLDLGLARGMTFSH